MISPEEIKMKIAELEQALLQSHPRMPILLKDIHSILKSDPANVTLLDESEIAIIISGLKKQTMTEISASTLKKSTKSLSKTTADDL